MAAAPAWVPYAVMAAGTVAKMQGDKQMEEEQRGILNRSLAETQKTQDKTSAAVAQEGEQYSPERRAMDMAAQEQGAFQRAQSDLGGSAGIVDSSTQGNVSAQFLKGKADKAISEGNRITEIAREQAKVRAPGQLMNEEALRRGAIAGEIGSQWGATNGMARAAQLDAQNVEQPGIGQLGQIAQMVGSVWAGGAGAGAEAAGTEGATGANGAFLGEGAGASGVPAWDAASSGAASMAAPSAGASSVWGANLAPGRRRVGANTMFGRGR